MTDSPNHTEFKPSHILDAIKPAKANKQKTTLKHLQKYIDGFHQHHVDIGLSDNSLADELPYRVVCNDNFVGCFLTWLAKEGTYLISPTLLKHSCCLGYASTFAEFYINKYRQLDTPRPFCKELWVKQLAQITSIKADYCYR